MNLSAKPITCALLMNGHFNFALETCEVAARKEFSQFVEWVNEGKILTVKIEPYRQRRSLNANAYMWVLLSKMAEVLKTDKDSLYLEVLDRYGVFTHIIVKPEVVERVKNEWRTVRELGSNYQRQAWYSASMLLWIIYLQHKGNG